MRCDQPNVSGSRIVACENLTGQETLAGLPTFSQPVECLLSGGRSMIS